MIKLMIVLFVLTVGAALFAEAGQWMVVSCDQIRQSVATYGLPTVEQFARSHGVSETELRRGRLKCLRE